MLRITNIRLSPDENESSLKDTVRKRYGIETVKSFRISKKSVDARHKNDVHYVYSVDVETENDSKYIGKNVSLREERAYILPHAKGSGAPVVIIGMGPAGMMCGLALAKSGRHVIICERGKRVDERLSDVEGFWRGGRLDPESNVQFGEGGAGTFSDGKLTTGINDFRISYILNEFYRHGAPEEILFSAKPHIGTDRLGDMAASIRKDIIAHGGDVRFSAKAVDIEILGGRVAGVVTERGGKTELIETDTLVLAIGHSARDTFEMLKSRGIAMRRKPFSAGVRIEHPQEMINKSQYGKFYKKLGAADYKLSAHLKNGRSVYTFCMCPGGYVVASASEEGCVVTNGMSRFDRSGANANSALLVNVTPEDFPGDDVLAGMYFQRETERRAFIAGGGDYRAPAARVGSFLGLEAPKAPPKISRTMPTYRPGVTFTELDGIFPEFITGSLREALPLFDKRLHGFASYDAILTAPETRSSSPVRIERDADSLTAGVEGLYPCGEGAGYAGGIMSAAVDGLRVAEKILGK